jgi:hypothetical protein
LGHSGEENADNEVAIVAAGAGAIPLLVQLGPGAPARVQGMAATALLGFTRNAAYAATIGSSGAIPPLVQMLG